METRNNPKWPQPNPDDCLGHWNTIRFNLILLSNGQSAYMTFAVLGTYLLSGWFSSNNNITYKNGRRLMTKVPGDEEIRNYDIEKQEDIGVTKKAESCNTIKTEIGSLINENKKLGRSPSSKSVSYMSNWQRYILYIHVSSYFTQWEQWKQPDWIRNLCTLQEKQAHIHSNRITTIIPDWNKELKFNTTLLRIPTGRRQSSWLFTSVAEDLNLRPPWNRSNPGPLNWESNELTTRPRCLPQYCLWVCQSLYWTFNNGSVLCLVTSQAVPSRG